MGISINLDILIDYVHRNLQKYMNMPQGVKREVFATRTIKSC